MKGRLVVGFGLEIEREGLFVGRIRYVVETTGRFCRIPRLVTHEGRVLDTAAV